MDKNKAIKQTLDQQYSFERPSQIPVCTTKASYERMLLHGRMQDAGNTKNLWACNKTGARIKARMVKRAVYEFGTNAFLEILPVAELFCGGCDPAPKTRGLDPIWNIELTTLSM